jgi:hypothetical protein
LMQLILRLPAQGDRTGSEAQHDRTDDALE